MKKLVKILGISMVLVMALVLMGAAPSFAQGPNPEPGSGGPGPCCESGMLRIDPTEMHAAIADALGISVGEFNAARAEGKTLYVIAQELGVDMTTVREAMSAVRQTAIDEALADGTITEAEADAIQARLGPGGNGYGQRHGPQNGQGFGAQGQMRGQGQQMGGQGQQMGGGQGFGPGNGAGWNR